MDPFDKAENKMRDIPLIGADLNKSVKHSKRGLIVDDDPDTVALLKIMLRMNGFDVAGAHSGSEALSLQEIICPDLVLLDYKMLEMSGRNLFQTIRKITSVPVIFITGMTKEHTAKEIFAMGADDCIIKPLDKKNLLKRVNALMLRPRKRLASVDGIGGPWIGSIHQFY